MNIRKRRIEDDNNKSFSNFYFKIKPYVIEKMPFFNYNLKNDTNGWNIKDLQNRPTLEIVYKRGETIDTNYLKIEMKDDSYGNIDYLIFFHTLYLLSQTYYIKNTDLTAIDDYYNSNSKISSLYICYIIKKNAIENNSSMIEIIKKMKNNILYYIEIKNKILVQIEADLGKESGEIKKVAINILNEIVKYGDTPFNFLSVKNIWMEFVNKVYEFKKIVDTTKEDGEFVYSGFNLKYTIKINDYISLIYTAKKNIKNYMVQKGLYTKNTIIDNYNITNIEKTITYNLIKEG